MKHTNKDRLFYDGNCPLCRAEMAKLAKHGQGKILLEDIHQIEPDPAIPEKHVLLARLHLLTAEGYWLVGIDANIRAWHHTPYRRFWQMLNWPIVRLFSHAGYEIWLRMRERQTCSSDRAN